jgi:hypothetical protein
MGQDNRIEKLEKQIRILRIKLEEAQSHTYIYDTDTLWCSDGELYFGYNNDKTLVMNVDQLFKDLPSIIRMVTKEQKKQQAMHHKMIKEAL